MTQVSGLDVAGGHTLNHPKFGELKVISSARKKKPGGTIVNVVKVKNGADRVGYLELTESQSFSVGTGGASPARPRPRFYVRSNSAVYDDDRTGHASNADAKKAAALIPGGYVSNRPA